MNYPFPPQMLPKPLSYSRTLCFAYISSICSSWVCNVLDIFWKSLVFLTKDNMWSDWIVEHTWWAEGPSPAPILINHWSWCSRLNFLCFSEDKILRWDGDDQSDVHSGRKGGFPGSKTTGQGQSRWDSSFNTLTLANFGCGDVPMPTRLGKL